MKVTKESLETIIKEEIKNLIENGEIDEGFFDRLGAKAAAAKTSIGSKIKGAAQKGLGSVVGAFGAEDAAAELKGAGEKTQAAGQKKAQAIKIHKIVNARLKELTTDLEKLGIDPNLPGVGSSLKTLDTTVKKYLAQATASEE